MKGKGRYSSLGDAINKIVKTIRDGNIDHAENMVNGLLVMNKQHPELLLLLAKIKLQSVGKEREALEAIRSALEVLAAPEMVFDIALDQLRAKKIKIAEEISRLVAIRFPSYYNAFNVWGVSLRYQERFSEAVDVFQQAIKLVPSDPSAWSNMGNAYLSWQKHDQALHCFSQALSLDKGNAETQRLKAVAHIKLAHYREAIEILERSLTATPDKIESIIDLCSAYYSLRDYEKGLETISKALEVNPNNIELLRTKAIMIRPMGKGEEAIAVFKQILQQMPNDVQTILALANAYYYTMGDDDNARKHYYMAYEKEPNNVNLLQKICYFLITVRNANESESANLQEAHTLIKRLLDLTHDYMSIANTAQSIFLSTLDYDNYAKLGSCNSLVKYWTDKGDNSALSMHLSRVVSLQDRIDLLAAHRAWGIKEEEIVASQPVIRKVKQRLNNKIRIGLMSADLRNHPVGYFTWPIVEHLDREKFEIYCYDFYPYKAGALKEEFVRKADSFKSYSTESNFEIAQEIADDHLDILFELGGSTAFNKISVCAYKPAPVQASWLGYPHSIGLPNAIDYIMVDPYINPQVPGLLIEKPFIMPKTWVVIEDKIGFKPVPIMDGIPQDRKGCITFGTLNIPHKLTLESLRVWAEIMHMTPNSRFLYVRPETEAPIFRENFLKHMNGYGISHERIAFGATRTHHLEYYNHIDIALDTFPHTGGTTTCEALWMGVPVVTLVGLSFFERISYSNLNNAGLSELCSFTIDEYKNKVMKLVADKERRLYLRHNLRQQILQNPLGQAQEFACDFGDTIMEALGGR